MRKEGIHNKKVHQQIMIMVKWNGFLLEHTNHYMNQKQMKEMDLHDKFGMNGSRLQISILVELELLCMMNGENLHLIELHL